MSNVSAGSKLGSLSGNHSMANSIDTASGSLAGDAEIGELLGSSGGGCFGETKRRSRNLNEKKRRDLFNSLLNELAILIGSRNRRSDKAKILKDTLQFLRLHSDDTSNFSSGDLDETVKPPFLTNSELLRLYLQSHSGFLVQFSVDTGSIRSVSEEVSACLGHEAAALSGESFYSLVHPAERDQVAAWCLKRSQTPDQSQIVIRCALERAPDPAAEPAGQLHRPEYCAVEIIGFLRQLAATGSAIGAVVRRYAGNCQLPCELGLPRAAGLSFQARLSLDWRFTEVDARCSIVIGQRPSALIGRPGFELCHPGDLEVVAAFLERLRRDGLSVCHACRHLLPSGDWLWLGMSAHANYAQWSGRPECYTCVYSPADRRSAVAAVAASASAAPSSGAVVVGFGGGGFVDASDQTDASSSSAVPTDSAADCSVWEEDEEDAMEVAAAAAAAHVGLAASAESLSPEQAEVYAQLCARYSRLSAAVRHNQEELDEVSRKLAVLSSAGAASASAGGVGEDGLMLRVMLTK